MNTSTVSNTPFPTSHTYHHTLHNIPYTITVIIDSTNVLIIEVENQSTGVTYVGKFSATYIDEMTHKTGNYKKFTLFCKMLHTALQQSNSNTVLIDILTYNDLQLLKYAKNGSIQHTNNNTVNPQHEHKRYFILTYISEYDRVHYPLPLKAEDSNSIEALQRQLQRLRTQQSDYHIIVDENKHLKQQIQHLLSNNNTQHNHTNTTLQQYKSDIQILTMELNHERHTNQQLQQQLDELNSTLAQIRDSERTYRLQCRKLQQDLDTLHANRYARTSYTNKTPNYTNKTPNPRIINKTPLTRGRPRTTTSVTHSTHRTASPSYMRPTNGSLIRSNSVTPTITRSSNNGYMRYGSAIRSRSNSVESIHRSSLNKLSQSTSRLLHSGKKQPNFSDTIRSRSKSPVSRSPKLTYSRYAYSPVNTSMGPTNDIQPTTVRRRERSPSLTKSTAVQQSAVKQIQNTMSPPGKPIGQKHETDNESKSVEHTIENMKPNTVQQKDTEVVNDRLSALQRFLRLEKAKLNGTASPVS